MELLLTNILKSLFLPPGINVLLVVIGIVLLRRHARTAMGLLIFSAATLYLLSIPAVSGLLAGTLEKDPPVTEDTKLGDYWQAIVVLGGGRTGVMPEYGSEVPLGRTLERLRFAARLHKKTGLPLLVSGGRVFGEGKSEAQLMSEVLAADFGVQPRWVESESRNTAENARYCRAVLNADGIDKIILVTHAMHMRRAERAFFAQGFAVKPAPTMFRSVGDESLWSDWFPQVGALGVSWEALHEHIGYLWYLIRY